MLFTAAAGLIARNVYQTPAPTAATLGSTAPATSSSTTDETDSHQVQLSADASGYPASNQVQTAMQNYFDGINHQDYATWEKAVTTARLNMTPRSRWKDFASTTDTDILIRRIESAPGNRLSVLLSFRSVQSVDNAPSFAPYPCILWNVVWPFAQEGGQWKLDVGAASTVPAYAKC